MMPYRQSCDRCRQQKARCMRVDSGHDVTDTYLPCERCIKAGAVCLYSSKQKSGRPPVLSPTRNYSDSRRPSLRGRHGSPPNHSLDGNMFSEANLPELPPLNTDNLLGWDMSPSAAGPSFATMQGPQHHMSPEHERTSQSSGSPSSHDEDSSEAWTARIAALTTQTTQTANRLVPSDISPPLTVSSPQVGQIFDATSTLLRILDGISEALRVASSSSTESTTDPTATRLTQDPGLIFLILACHQRLLDSFQAICDSIRWSLDSMSSHQSEDRGTLPWKRTLHGDEGLPCVAQFVMVLQLVSHLLNQLDMALSPSPTHSLSRGQNLRSSFDFSAITDPDISPSWTIPPLSSLSSSQSNSALLLFRQEADVSKKSEEQGFVRLAKGFLTTVPDQHTTLNNKIRELQDSINDSRRL